MSGLGATLSSIRTKVFWPFYGLKTALFTRGQRRSVLPASSLLFGRDWSLNVTLEMAAGLQGFTLPQVDPLEDAQTSQMPELRQGKRLPRANDPIRLDVSLDELIEANDEIVDEEVASEETPLELSLEDLHLEDAHEAIDSLPALPFENLHLIPNYKIADRYRLQGKLGNGGMGSIYLGFDEVRKNWVAIKVANNAESRNFIAKEIKTLLRLGKGNRRIVDCLASGVNFIVLEFIDGDPLAKFVEEKRPRFDDYIDQTGRFNSAVYQAAFFNYTVETLQIVRNIFKGLEYAHGKDVIHADLTLDNVMMKGSMLKIIDFGLSELVKERDTDRVFGKPYAMSTEQARAEQLDGRTDIYAVGIMLYSMLARRKPFAMSPLQRQFPEEDLGTEIILRKWDGDVLGYPLPTVGKSEILNIFKNDSSWRHLFVNIWTVDKRKVEKVFGNDPSWKRFFVDPNRAQLTFRPEVDESEILSVQDSAKREALLDMYRLTQRDILTFRPDAEGIINSRVKDEGLKADILLLLREGQRRLSRSVSFYNLEHSLKYYLGNDLGERIYNLMGKMAAANKEERFQTATEARLAVEAILEDIEDNPPLFYL